MRSHRRISIAVGIALALSLYRPAVAVEDGNELADSLRATELAFATSVAAKDREAFAAFLDEEAVFAAGQVFKGKGAVVEGWAGFFAPNGPQLEWEPDSVVVRGDGTLGLSQGPFTLTLRNPEGEEIVQRGRFISVWERRENGEWKILFDSGCPPCPDCGDR
jgi:ketosteroid isomerase-like protein